MVLGEKAREQHPMPVLVGALVDQVIDRVAAGTCVDPITQVACVCSQTIAQPALLTAHVAVGLVVVYRERFQCPPGTSLGDVAGLYDRPL